MSALSVTAGVGPFSAGHAAFLFTCVSHVISLLLSPRFGACTAGVRPFPLAMQHFYSFVFQVISIFLSPRFGACTAGVRLFPLAMQHFYSFVFQVISIFLFPRFGACTAGVRPFLLAMQHFYSFVSHDFSFCLSGSVPALLVSALFRWPCVSRLVSLLVGHCWSLCPPSLPSLSLFLRSCLPSCWSLCLPSCLSFCWSCVRLVSLLFGHCVPLVSLLSPVLSPFLWATVSAFCFLLSPFCLALSLVLSTTVHCKAEADTAQSWVTNVKDCKGLQGRGCVSTFVSQLWTGVAASALQSQLWTSQALAAECSGFENTNCLGSTVV